MSDGACKDCGVHPCAREHRLAHREFDKRRLRLLEETGGGPHAALLRRQIEFDEDKDAGKIAHEDFQRIFDELQRDWLRLFGGLAWYEKQPTNIRALWARPAHALRQELS
jgi:hypothetical protein